MRWLRSSLRTVDGARPMSLATVGTLRPQPMRNSIRFRMSMSMCFMVVSLYAFAAASLALASILLPLRGIGYTISGHSKSKRAFPPRGGSEGFTFTINNSQSLRRVNERQKCVYFWRRRSDFSIHRNLRELHGECIFWYNTNTRHGKILQCGSLTVGCTTRQYKRNENFKQNRKENKDELEDDDDCTCGLGHEWNNPRHHLGGDC